MKKTKKIALAVLVGVASCLVYTRLQKPSLNQSLCVAASKGDTAAVEKLLRQGANPNAVGTIGNSDCDCEDNPSPAPALVLAIFQTSGNTREHIDTVAALLRGGADVNARADGGMTALMWANSPRVARFLLAHGAKVNLKNDYGNTALICAADGSDVRLVKTLTDAGADVNTRDNRGDTAFINAYQGNDGAIPRTLVAAGADINARDCDGKTALGHALEDNDMGRIDFLKKMGANQ